MLKTGIGQPEVQCSFHQPHYREAAGLRPHRGPQFWVGHNRSETVFVCLFLTKSGRNFATETNTKSYLL